ncbi:MAG TPA: choice-of-anchor Q domain-containing protein [Bryobacteraceae bacterium]|nr:choice-of-anchor Q domain-containing protein [Bryobacteraceae bacterium]
MALGNCYKLMKSRIFALLVLSVLPVCGATTRLVTTTNDFGSGTLRQAILEANTSSGDTINFAAGVNGFLVLQSALPTIVASMTINGPGAANLTITGSGRSQCFVVDGSYTVALSGLTIANCTGAPNGGALLDDLGTVTLTNVNLTANSAAGGLGGAIYNLNGMVTLTNANLAENSANQGGGIYSTGVLTLNNSTLSTNSASLGGGALYTTSAVVGNNLTMAGNHSSQNGGGVYLTTVGSFSVTGVTISGNSATGNGGGIYSDSVVTLTNATLWGNTASQGGAIYSDTDAILILINSTLSANSASAGGGFYNLGFVISDYNVLAHGASGGNCLNSGTTESEGYNISDDTTCTAILTKTGDLNNTPAGLNPAGLQNNGGPTLTIALLPTSPAVNHQPTAECPTTDQRGVARPQGPACDSGAYELAEFSAFTANLGLVSGTLGHFDLNATVTLGSTKDSFDSATDAVTLQVASYSVTLPAGSLVSAGPGAWSFSGIVNGVILSMQIESLGDARYEVTAQGAPIHFTGVTSPALVSIAMGVNTGSTHVAFTPVI